MSEMKCACGGKYLALGREFLRTGAVAEWSVLAGHSPNDWNEGCIPGELFVCDTCRGVKFCADLEWINQRLARRAAAEQAPLTEEEKLRARRETVIQSYTKDFARYKREKLEKIAQRRTFTQYPDEAVEAAQRLLREKEKHPEFE